MLSDDVVRVVLDLVFEVLRLKVPAWTTDLASGSALRLRVGTPRHLLMPPLIIFFEAGSGGIALDRDGVRQRHPPGSTFDDEQLLAWTPMYAARCPQRP